MLRGIQKWFLAFGLWVGAAAVSPTSALAEGCVDLITQTQENAAQAAALLMVGAGSDLAQTESLIGIWTADLDPSNNAGIHCHVLKINTQTGPNRYTAILDTTFPGGESRQTCDVAASRTSVTIECEFVSATTVYIDDNFTLTRAGNVMSGLSRDDAGTFGTVDFCRIE